LSGGAATIAAAQAPDMVSGIVEINPFTRVVKPDLGAFVKITLYRRGSLLLGGVVGLKSLRFWLRYSDVAYPTKPADWAELTAGLRAKLTEPGRMKEFLKAMNHGRPR